MQSNTITITDIMKEKSGSKWSKLNKFSKIDLAGGKISLDVIIIKQTTVNHLKPTLLAKNYTLLFLK